MCAYLEHGVLPADEKLAKKVSGKYEVIQGILYFEPDFSPGRLCIVVPESLRPMLLQEDHAGCFAYEMDLPRVLELVRVERVYLVPFYLHKLDNFDRNDEHRLSFLSTNHTDEDDHKLSK